MEFEPMPRLHLRHRVTFLGTAFLTSAEILSNRRAIAHTDHYKTEPSDQTSPSDSKPPNLLSEPANTLDTAEQEAVPINKVSSEVNASPTSNQPEDKTVIEEIPASQEPTSTSKSGLFGGFSVGLGEPLLALIVVAPFVLRVWKKRSRF